jgi:hypothetical protein
MIVTTTDVTARPSEPAFDPINSNVPTADGTNDATLPRLALPNPIAPPASSGVALLEPPSAKPALYDRNNLDVTPPTPVLPRLLAGLRASSPGVRVNALTIAVVVKADGTVESATGLTPPQNISEVLLLTQALSIVRSWRFTPAMKDGTPVMYRQVVPLRDLGRPTP